VRGGRSPKGQRDISDCKDSKDMEVPVSLLSLLSLLSLQVLYVPLSTHRATTPMFAMVALFVIDGTAQMYKTTPATGARASKITLPT